MGRQRYDNFNDPRVKEIYQRSKFLKQVYDFAYYVQGEYIEDSNDRTLIVIAADNGLDNGHLSVSSMAIGNNAVLNRSFAIALSDKEMQEQLQIACDIIGARQSDQTEDIGQIRRTIRKLYWFSALVIVWSIVSIILTVVGFFEIAPTISALLLMAFLGCLLYREISSRNRLIQQIMQKRIEQVNDKLRTLGTMLEHLHKRMNDEEED